MKAKTKLIILTVVLSVCIIATVTGVTVAYWMGAEGTNVVAPQTDTTDWNPWAKYVIYEARKNAQGVTIGYDVVGCTAILENVIIPQYATGGWLRDENGNLTKITATGVNTAVLEVRNTLFAGTTDKAIPVTLTIPTTVDVEVHAFAGLTNLTKITIKTVQGINSTTDDYLMTIGQLAFLECPNVTEFIVTDQATTLDVPGVSISSFEDFKNATGLFVAGLERTNA